MNITEQRRRQMLVGRVKRLYDAGHGVTKIAKELNLPESTIRSCVEDIKKAYENK